MSLSPGSRLGPYEVLSSLGAGGMGEVYRARDTKLKREVALKVLPDSFASDPDRVARFQREAEVLASLNHPHIAAIHGFETDTRGGAALAPPVHALVMELVEGEDLSQRIARGPIPVDEALPIARQIAEALEAAHDQGIVHRDLKPANIKVRDDGTVKVLDFGLAKALDRAGLSAVAPGAKADGSGGSGREDSLNSPTITTPAHTLRGVILGTAAYMSPEQARGKAVDKRSDIWAFGAIVFEMLTGNRLFDGETISDTIAAVLTRTPDLNGLPPSTPARVRELIARCLERDPKRRLRDIGEARVTLESPGAVESAGATAIPAPTIRPSPTATWRVVVPWVIAVAALAAAGWTMLSRPATPPALSLELELAPPADSQFIIGSNAGAPVIAPDGSKVVFLAPTANGVELWVRSLVRDDARPLSGTEGASYPFWSPDSLKLGFFTGGKLRTVDVAGGLPNVIADAANGRGGSWTESGVILFSPQGGGTVSSVPEKGGTATSITKLDVTRGENAHYFPVALPGGETFLFFIRSAQLENNGIYLGRVDGSQPPQRVVTSLSAALFVPAHGREPNRLLWVRDTDLLAQRFDPATGQLEGPVAVIASDVRVEESQRALLASASRTGTLVWATARAGTTQLAWYDRNGRRGETLPIEPGRILQPQLSPNGQQLSFTRVLAGAGDVWVHDFTSGVTRQLSNSPYYDENGAWSHDGRFIAHQAVENGRNIIRVVAVDGSMPARTVAVDDLSTQAPTFSSDGRYVFFIALDKTNTSNMAAVRLDDASQRPVPIPLAVTPSSEFVGPASPDGQWLIFLSDRNGKMEVTLARIRIDAGTVTLDKDWVTVGAGQGGHWRRDNGEIIYSAPDGMLMAVAVSTASGAIRLGKPTPLFRVPTNAGGWSGSYDVTPDHTRIVAVESPYSDRQAVRVLTNWESRLAAR